MLCNPDQVSHLDQTQTNPPVSPFQIILAQLFCFPASVLVHGVPCSNSLPASAVAQCLKSPRNHPTPVMHSLGGPSRTVAQSPSPDNLQTPARTQTLNDGF